jgi:hypothetical protein
MKTWLTKFRISAAFDADGLSSPSKRRSLGDSEESRRFKETIQTLDGALSNRPAASDAPPDLHSAIMNAVRASRGNNRGPTVARRGEFASRWIPAPALATLSLLGLWWFLHRPPAAPVQPASTGQASILGIGSALELGENAARDVPPVVVAPLADELGRVNLDLENAGRFLLTSLP